MAAASEASGSAGGCLFPTLKFVAWQLKDANLFAREKDTGCRQCPRKTNPHGRGYDRNNIVPTQLQQQLFRENRSPHLTQGRCRRIGCRGNRLRNSSEAGCVPSSTFATASRRRISIAACASRIIRGRLRAAKAAGVGAVTPFQKIADALERRGYGPGKKSGKNLRFRCPAHDDKSPSLDVAEGREGSALLICRSHNCPSEAILNAVDLELKDCFPDDDRAKKLPLKDRIVATYDYRDENGQLLYQSIRLYPKDFRQRQPDERKPEGAEWRWNMDGARLVPYRLPQLLNAPADAPVFVVEGEKDADNLARHKLIATTSPMGAGKWSKLGPEALQAFTDRFIIILPDNDPSGREHAYDVVVSLLPIAREIAILELPGLPEKGDVSDWLNKGGKIDELLKLTAGAPRIGDEWVRPPKEASKPDTGNTNDKPQSLPWPAPKYASELSADSATVNWVWSGMLAGGHLTLLSALAKCGKTTFLSFLLRALQGGRPFLDRPTKQSNTLLISEESETIWAKRRDVLKLSNHLSVICRPFLAKPNLAAWTEFLIYASSVAVDRKCDLVVLDTFSAFVPWKNENDAAEVMQAILPLHRLTQTGKAVLLFHHFGKGDPSEGRAARGSTAMVGAVDIVLELRRFKPDEQSDRRRVLNGLGRFDEVPDELVISLNEDGSGYSAEGSRKDVVGRESADVLREYLPDGPPGVTADEVHKAMPDDNRPRRGDVMKALQSGSAVGSWQGAGTGKKGDPRKFWRG